MAGPFAARREWRSFAISAREELVEPPLLAMTAAAVRPESFSPRERGRYSDSDRPEALIRAERMTALPTWCGVSSEDGKARPESQRAAKRRSFGSSDRK